MAMSIFPAESAGKTAFTRHIPMRGVATGQTGTVPEVRAATFGKEKSRTMATNVESKSAVAALAGKLIAGTGKHLAGVTQVLLVGGSYTPAEVTSKLQQIVTLRAGVDAAKAAAKTKLVSEKTDMPALRTFMDAYVTYVKAAFGSVPDALADFGLAPKKVRAPLTSEQKAAAAAKSKATREARNTMGSKQKRAVKGNVVGITVTPVTAPTPVEPKAPAAPAAPAAPTAGTTSPDPKVATTPHTAT